MNTRTGDTDIHGDIIQCKIDGGWGIIENDHINGLVGVAANGRCWVDD